MSFMQRWSRRKHESAHQAPQEPAVDETESDNTKNDNAAAESSDGSLNWKGKEFSLGDNPDDTNPTISLTTTNDWSD